MEIKDKEKALKSMPYFQEWLKELGESVENLDTIILEGEVRELSAEEKLLKGDTSQWKAFESTGFMMVGMTFHEGDPVGRHIPNGTVRYIPEEESEKSNA